jgi:hypothetical protein
MPMGHGFQAWHPAATGRAMRREQFRGRRGNDSKLLSSRHSMTVNELLTDYALAAKIGGFVVQYLVLLLPGLVALVVTLDAKG